MSKVRTHHVLACALLLAGLAAPASIVGAQPAPDPSSSGLEATGLVPDGAPTEAPKATSSTLAETDPALLARTDGARVPVVIKFDYDAIASYAGGLRGLPATSPSATGEDLTRADTTTGPYARNLVREEAAIVADVQAAVPGATIGQRLRIVYGGVAATIPANAVEALLEVPGVVAVQADSLEQPLTDASPSFIGADQVWPELGGEDSAGNGIIFGTIDSGIWPEHPSFADVGTTGTPPTKADGTPRACNYGDNPLTPANDPFVCNRKVIGGQRFLATYQAQGQPPEVYGSTARDSDGHGSHTASTVAGNHVDNAPVKGIERGPVGGVAPGAWVSTYKVCGSTGCYGSDSAAAVAQAILDGVDVINFSISGGTDPATDVVELAFLDAYRAGVFVAASAGNDGPGTGTVNHLGPWTTTVAASTPPRTFSSTLTLNGTAGATQALTGTNIAQGVASPLPVVLASAPPYSNGLCTTPAPAGLFAGKVVVCQRGPGRVAKGYNVLQGGAAGMVLYNSTPLGTTADTHFLPTVHLPSGTDLLAFLAANPGATASFPAGAKVPQAPDVIAAFSSRGPGGLALKPDVAAPGVQILAAHTPTPDDLSGGPAGETFRAIDGTSMAAPHVAGAAALLQALHPTWSPGQIRSALMGSATPAMTKEDGTTPATPFDMGSGRVQVAAAAEPGLLLDETGDRFVALGTDPANVAQLNLASINAPTLPGRLEVTRTVTNPGAAATYTAGTSIGSGSSITVEPASFTLASGASQELTITLETTNTAGAQEFGSVAITAPGRNDTRWPVAFRGQPGTVRVDSLGCTPATVPQLDSSTCEYVVQTDHAGDVAATLRAEGDAVAQVTGADQGATTAGGVATAQVTVEGSKAGVPAIAPATNTPGGGYLPLAGFGITPVPIDDEAYTNYNVPAFVYNGATYSRIGIYSNGYVVVGGGTAADNNCCNPAIPSASRPNNVLAPYWTDLDGTGRPGISLGSLTDGVNSWIVVQWEVSPYGSASVRRFQAWIGRNGTQDISFEYDAATLPSTPDRDLVVGAENELGGGAALGAAPTGASLRVTSSAVTPAVPLTWKVTAKGLTPGTGTVQAEASSSTMAGTSVARSELAVTALPAPVVTDDPDALTIDALDTASFTAAATGGTLVRWEERAAGGSTWSTVAGATASPLTFTAHGDDDGTSYRAVFANALGGETASAAATLTVERLATSAVVSVSPASPTRGQDVSFTVELTPDTVGGTVQFAVDGTDVGVPVAVVDGSATSAPVADLAAGTHEVTATATGDVDHLGTTDDADFTVARNTSATAVVDVDPDVIVIGDTVVVDVTVSPAPTGGTVQLRIDGTPAGDPFTLDATGAGSGAATGVGVGSHTVTATFSGDDDLDPSSSAAFPFAVTKRTATLDATATPAAPTRGQDVTVTAVVGPEETTGTVQFALDGGTPSAPVALVDGEATSPAYADLPAGSHRVVATYSGDAESLTATDTATFTVAKLESETTLEVAGPDTPAVGDAVAVAIAVDPVPAGGTVQLAVDGTDVGAPIALDGDGEATATIPDLALGAHDLTATFSGDDDLLTSEGEADVTLVSADEAFVRRAFEEVLGRTADPAGRAHWVAKLGNGTSKDALVSSLASSAEGRGRLVDASYQRALGRPADPSGRAHWVAKLGSGLTAEDLLATLIGSAEGYAHGGGTASAFADALYPRYLGRVANAGGAAYWRTRVAGANTPAGRRTTALAFGRLGEVTRKAVAVGLDDVCGVPTTPEITTMLTSSWSASGRNPLRQAGSTLVLACSPGTR